MGVPGGPPPPGGPWEQAMIEVKITLARTSGSTIKSVSMRAAALVFTHHVVPWRWGGVRYLQGEKRKQIIRSEGQKILNVNLHRVEKTLKSKKIHKKLRNVKITVGGVVQFPWWFLLSSKYPFKETEQWLKGFLDKNWLKSIFLTFLLRGNKLQLTKC